MSIAQHLQDIRASLPGGVTLVAVSKTKPDGMIMEAYEAGQRDFGENYVQELADKAARLPKDIRWHFIGHLQSNKVKYIAPFVHLVHSVDSLKLLQEIDRQGARHNRVIGCLLQVYIAGEDTKFGLEFDACEALLAEAGNGLLRHTSIKGLMGMASLTDNPAQIGTEFASLGRFFSRLRTTRPGLDILSMGMSSDYKTALENGSNMVRVGSSIFGERSYPARP